MSPLKQSKKGKGYHMLFRDAISCPNSASALMSWHELARLIHQKNIVETVTAVEQRKTSAAHTHQSASHGVKVDLTTIPEKEEKKRRKELSEVLLLEANKHPPPRHRVKFDLSSLVAHAPPAHHYRDFPSSSSSLITPVISKRKRRPPLPDSNEVLLRDIQSSQLSSLLFRRTDVSQQLPHLPENDIVRPAIMQREDGRLFLPLPSTLSYDIGKTVVKKPTDFKLSTSVVAVTNTKEKKDIEEETVVQFLPENYEIRRSSELKKNFADAAAATATVKSKRRSGELEEIPYLSFKHNKTILGRPETKYRHKVEGDVLDIELIKRWDAKVKGREFKESGTGS